MTKWILATMVAASALAGGPLDALAAPPDGKGAVTMPARALKDAAAAGQLKLNITYHGGPVLNKPAGANVYYIWYGNWAGDTATNILTAMMQNVSGSSWYRINTTYYGGKQNHVFVPNLVTFVQATTDSYSQGTALSDAQIRQVVSDAITSGRLPKDANAVYFVLTSKDVTATSGFCSQYCGWHDHATVAASDIKYAFVGNAMQQCPSGCIAPENQQASPNGNVGADGMASVVMHELVEAISDPDLNAWSDLIGQENADKCAWTFGTEQVAANGSRWNVNFGTGQYLVQRNWRAAKPQGCLQGM